MGSIEALTGDYFATDFDWRRFRRVTNVGGPKGSKVLAILKRHPQLNALVLDHAGVVDGAAEHLIGKVEPVPLACVAFQTGDFLTSVPAARNEGDIYLLNAVVHGMDDADCIQVLRNLASASRKSSARHTLKN